MKASGPALLEVTVVSSYGSMGGAERWLLDLLAADAEMTAGARLRVDAVLLGDGPLAGELDRRGVPVRWIPAGTGPMSLVGPALAVARHLRRRRPEIVLANGVKAALVAGAAGWLTGVRVVWGHHDHSFDGMVSLVLSRLVDAVVATSAELAAASRHRWAAVVPPPRPPDSGLDRGAARQELARHGTPIDGLLLGMVGRLVRYKGCEDAVRALAEPGAAAWHLVLVGPDEQGGERDRLSALAAELGVAGRVTLTGHVGEARRVMSAFDAVAVLTRPAGDGGPGREGFGLSALEAMAAGVPVIAAGSVPVLTGGDTGLAVDPADPAAVARALVRLELDGDRLRTAGRSAAAAHPGPGACAEALVRFLAAVARRPGAGRRGERPVSVVTTVKDEAATASTLVRALSEQLRVPGDEVVVVDGGSTDGTAEILDRHADEDARVRVLSAPGAGISAGRNAAIRVARNDRVLLTDAGCHPVPGWLEAFRAAAEETGAPDLLTGVYRARAGTPVEAAFAAVGYPDPDELRHPDPLSRAYGRLLGRSFDPTRPTGRSMSVTRAAWATAGGFAEHLATGEDVMFGQAVTEHSSAALVADAEVIWGQRDSVAATARMYVGYGRGSGRSRDPVMLTRDLLRAGAYPVFLVLAAGGPRARALLGASAVAYLSLPWRRAARHGLLAVAAVPVAAAVRDLAKAWGAIAGLVEDLS